MATYEVTDPTSGQTLELTGDSPPSIDELEQIFASMPAEQPQQQTIPNYEEVFKADEPQGFVRDIGLHARSTMEGVGGMVDFLGTPIRIGMQAAGLGDPAGGATRLADYLNLPTPETPVERGIAGTTKVLSGGMGMMGLASKGAQVAKEGGTAQRALQAMSARPDLQFSSALGAGAAGTAAQEMGANWAGQLAASIAGGVAAPMGVTAGQKIFAGGKRIIDKIMGDPQLNAKIDLVIESALKTHGSTLDDLAPAIKNQLHQDMKAAMKTGEISPDVVRRLVDYRTTGLTPTAGRLSLDPGMITKQENLARLGASSSDPKLQRLAQIKSENNALLIENMNKIGGGLTDDVSAGRKVIGALQQKEAIAKKGISKAYEAARTTSGRSAKLDPRAFTQKANDMLDAADAGGALPAEIRTKLNSIATGETPLTVATAQQFRKNINRKWGKAQGEERFALGEVKKALDETPLLEGQGDAARQAYTGATKKAAEWMAKVDKTPALKAIRDGVEPDKFMQTYVIGSGKPASIDAVMRLKRVIKDNPDAMTAVKSNMTQWLKEKALGGAADEVAAFSPASFNRALKSIGDEKLKMFFSPQEFKALKAIGRVSSYEKVQPVGSAVNNSNTAAAGIAFVLDRLSGSTLLRRAPWGAGVIAEPAAKISGSIQAGQMTKIPTQIGSKKEAVSLLPPLLAPYLLSE